MSCWISPMREAKEAMHLAASLGTRRGQGSSFTSHVQPGAGEGVEVAARVATRVFASPVFISASWPYVQHHARSAARRKWRMPSTRLPASRPTAIGYPADCIKALALPGREFVLSPASP